MKWLYSLCQKKSSQILLTVTWFYFSASFVLFSLLLCLIVRIPFEAPDCDMYDEYKYQLIEYGLKLLHLSQDSSLVFESCTQEAIMSVVSALFLYSYPLKTVLVAPK